MGLERDRATGWTVGRVLQDACWDLTSSRSTTISPSHRAVAEALILRLAR